VVTLSVWKALFLREAITRLSTGRVAWLWLILKPLLHVSFLMFLFVVIRKRVVPGADTGVFFAIGILSYFTFANAAIRSMGAIEANAALFSYRQVFPVDTVLVRCMLEGLIQVFVAFIVIIGAEFIGLDALPHNPLAALLAVSLLWLLGTGLGLILSAGSALIPEIAKIVGSMFFPLYFMSGAMYPLYMVPPILRDIMLLNPIMHGIEYVRSAFFSGYYLQPSVDISYLAGWAIVMLFLGLALHVRFARRLAAL
jgi:capsular polysaccharide transport system permease protein